MSDANAFDFGKFIPGFDFLQKLSASAPGAGGAAPGLHSWVAPTVSVDELDKRIKDMKAVEGWLRMNLSMLQMTIQGLEMQRTTVGTVHAMGQMASQAAQQMQNESAAAPEAAETDAEVPAFLTEAMMFPWQMMQQMREHLEQMQPEPPPAPEAKPEPAAKAPPKKRSPPRAGTAAKKKTT